MQYLLVKPTLTTHCHKIALVLYGTSGLTSGMRLTDYSGPLGGGGVVSVSALFTYYNEFFVDRTAGTSRKSSGQE